MRIAAPTYAEPAGWSPGAVSPATSTRAPGLIRGALDAWLGHREHAVGVPLTGVQIATLAPFLARELAMDPQIVLADLARTRILVGGLAHDAGNVATTIGTNIYVSDAARATRMLEWSHRGWLAHELVHTMQWRRTGAVQASDSAHDRAFLNAYVGAFARHDGSFGAGGIVQAVREFARRHRAREPIGKIGDLIHDTHPMEREAIIVARAFVDATT